MKAPRETEELNMADARRELTRLPERLAAQPATVTVTRRGKPVLAILAWEDYEAIWETLDILGDEQAANELRRSVHEVKAGETIAWEAAKQQLR